MLYTEQQVLNNLKFALQSNDVVYISGNPGLGKEYTVRHYLKLFENNQYIAFNPTVGKEYFIEYSPFKDTFAKEPISKLGFKELASQGSDLASEQSDIKISLLGMLSKFLINLSIDKKSNALSIFDNSEVDIIAKMHNLIRKKHIKIFSFFNVCDWDDKSKFFLCQLIQYKKQMTEFNDVKFIITGQDKQPAFFNSIESDNIYQIQFPQIDINFENEQQIFEIVLNKSLSSELYDKLLPIIKICNNDMNLLKLFVDDNFESENANSNDGLSSIKKLLKYKLKSMGADQINIESTLKYASVLGMYFSIPELENILEKSKNEFTKFIEDAQHLYLINASDNNDNSYSFAHEFIQKVMELSITSDSISVYDKAQRMVSKLYPYDYIRRARYCMKAKDYENAKMLFVLYIFRNVRNSENLPETIKSESERLFDNGPDSYIWRICIDLYKQGIQLYNNGCYEDAMTKFESINKVMPKEILCEIDIMKTMCLTKKLDGNSRETAVTILENDLKDERPCCISVLERMRVRLIILYAHFNMTEKANETEEELFSELGKRISYDVKASETVALLERISNSHYSCDVARNKMKNAVNFFGPSDNEYPSNIVQYFNALTNYSGALCMCGEFDKSFECAQKAIDLKNQFMEVNYPREYFVANNYVISGFLSGNLSEIDCIDKFSGLIKKVPDSADRLLFCSNLAVFYSLAGDHKKAINILTRAIDKCNINMDPEKIYNYRYTTNMSVFYFLLGDTCTAKKILSQCADIDITIPDSKYMRNKILKLSDLFEQDKNHISPKELLYYFNDEGSVATANKYYYLGYTFTTQYNWDID